MLKQKLIRYMYMHPAFMDFCKYIFSYPLMVNNSLYKHYVLRRAARYASGFSRQEIKVFIETVLNCNAHCLMCGHRYKPMSGIMAMELYRKIIDDCFRNNILRVGLSVYGEPLLDPYFFERISYLRKFNMNYGFFTNGSLMDTTVAEKLFELGGLERINFSVCGYSPEVYERIMQGLKRDTSYGNILHFLRLKEQYKRNDLEVIISTVKLSANKSEMNKFIRFWRRQKGVDRLITADLGVRGLDDEKISGVGVCGMMYKKGVWLPPCRQLWECLFIYYNGKISPCADDNDRRELILGDINTQSLDQILTGRLAVDLQKLHLGNQRNTHSVCGGCHHNSVWV